jgi:hypothetical protein
MGAKTMRFENTVLSGLLKAIPRGQFAGLVAVHGSDRGVRRLRSWSQLVALLVAQLGGCRSLRELEAPLASQSGNHYHLGIGRACRSTLAVANASARPACSRRCSVACSAGWPTGCRKTSAARRCGASMPPASA